MQEIVADVDAWLAEGQPVAVATVIQTWGSAPRKAGAKMALTIDGRLSGSVSGGCVEGAVVEIGQDVLAEGRPRLVEFGVADETAWDVGLACGGSLQLFIEPLAPTVYATLRAWRQRDQAGVAATVIAGPEEIIGRSLLIQADGQTTGALTPSLDDAVRQAGLAALQRAQSGVYTPAAAPDTHIFLEVHLPAPQLILVGGVHIAIALAHIAATLGYHTVVIDPRRAFGNQARFPQVDRLIQQWPDEAFQSVALNANSAVALLTHDPKIDDPALQIVLPSPAFYVGALGSSRTHARRRERLARAGLDQALIDRIRGPIGLDINAQTPEEIAVAIMAEIIAERRRPIAQA